jgi:hypothetical protein
MSQNGYTLGSDVTRYLNSMAKHSGSSPESIIEEALWEYLPKIRERTLERKKLALEAAVLSEQFSQRGNR